LFKKFIFLLLVIIFPIFSTAQSIAIYVDNKPLSEVLYQMRDNYQVQFTFNSDDLKECFITKSTTYKTAEEAITDLLSSCNLICRKQGDVYVILSKDDIQANVKPKPNFYLFSGKVVDSQKGETLPSAVIRNKYMYLTTDVTGYFSFKLTDSIAVLEIHYLGYVQKDTIIAALQHHLIELQPATLQLKEVVIKSETPVFDIHNWQEAANIKLNHRISRFLPGNIDNGIYNMLRLQPGILASGEQTNDYTIWGSYIGQNLVEYNHIKLFTTNSFDDNHSIVHPLMIKEIDVIKGGFNAEYGNAVGGIVSITGKNGDCQNLHGNANINNQSLSGYLNIPIAKQFAIQAAYRQTINDIINREIESKDKNKDIDYYRPETSFRDLNVRLSGKISRKDNFHINLLASKDDSRYNFESDTGKFYNVQSHDTRKQIGTSAVYNRFFKNGIYTKTVLSYSKLESAYDFDETYSDPDNTSDNYSINSLTTNLISELSIKQALIYPAKGIHKFSLSAEYYRNTASYQNDTNYFNVKDYTTNSNRLGLLAKDNISLFGKMSIQAGIRLDYQLKSNQLYLQPRLSANFDITKKIRLNAAIGKYNQFLNTSMIYNHSNTLFSIWEIIDTEKQEATSAMHYTLGMSFNKSPVKINVEGFYKTIQNIYGYNISNKDKDLFRINGKAKIAGVDFYLKTQLGKHEVWVAYTLSESLQNFDYFETYDYKPAPQNQTHELKGAAILNFSPLYFSANYVYGSGLEFTRSIRSGTPIPYNRLDVATMYKITIRKVNYQLGLSVLNVFNTYNVKYTNAINLPDEKSVYSQSIPFTILFNLYIGF